jgi:hypothetical protein
MSATSILPYLESNLTKEEVRHFHDNDLLQVIVLTDTVMCRRLLTDIEISNFWLVIEERRQRVQQSVSILCERFGPGKVSLP